MKSKRSPTHTHVRARACIYIKYVVNYLPPLINRESRRKFPGAFLLSSSLLSRSFLRALLSFFFFSPVYITSAPSPFFLMPNDRSYLRGCIGIRCYVYKCKKVLISFSLPRDTSYHKSLRYTSGIYCLREFNALACHARFRDKIYSTL